MALKQGRKLWPMNGREHKRLYPSTSKYVRDSEEDEEEDKDGNERSYRKEEDLLPKWKLYLVFAAIFVCFAVLYPSVFSPILNSILGRGGHAQQRQQQQLHNVPLPSGPEGKEKSSSRPHMHPAAMRMPHAAEQPQGGGRSGGTFTWLLPFYTVGVVAFLLYTLCKPKKEKRRSRGRRLENWHAGDGSEDEDDDRTRALQARLLKTESAMKQILEQLEDIANSGKDTNMLGTVGQEHNVGKKVGDNQLSGLTSEQMLEMENGLKELKLLSEICKKQRASLDGQRHSSESSFDSTEHGPEEEWEEGRESQSEERLSEADEAPTMPGAPLVSETEQTLLPDAEAEHETKPEQTSSEDCIPQGSRESTGLEIEGEELDNKMQPAVATAPELVDVEGNETTSTAQNAEAEWRETSEKAIAMDGWSEAVIKQIQAAETNAQGGAHENKIDETSADNQAKSGKARRRRRPRREQ